MSRFLAEKLSVLKPYVPGEQPQDMQYVKLNTNESPYPPAPALFEAVNNEEITKLRLYSDPELKELIGAVSEFHGIDKNKIFCSNGSDEVLSFAFLAWGDKGVAYADITYGFYPVFTQLYGLNEKIIPLEEDFSIDTSRYEGLNRMCVIANPNAPTGKSVSVESIRKIAKTNPDNVVIVDEAYVDFGGESAISLIDECENILVVRTFSKSRQLAGARLGYAMGSEALIADLNRVKFSFNPYNVNRLTSLLGTLSMKDKDWFELCRNKIINTRKFTTEELRNRGFEVIDSLANFIFAKPCKISGEDYYLKLKENGVLVRYFNKDRIRDYVRITIGTDEEMKTLIEKTDKILKELQ